MSFEVFVILLSDPDNVRVISEKQPHVLEDHRTLEFYNIEQSSVLFFLLNMPGGGGMIYVFTC